MKELPNPEEFLLDTGLLFQVNRTVLHPLGLSLSVVTEESPNGSKTSHLQMVETDNPVGFVFEDEEMKTEESKFQTYMQTTKPRVLTRGKSLGFIVQGSPT